MAALPEARSLEAGPFRIVAQTSEKGVTAVGSWKSETVGERSRRGWYFEYQMCMPLCLLASLNGLERLGI